MFLYKLYIYIYTMFLYVIYITHICIMFTYIYIYIYIWTARCSVGTVAAPRSRRRCAAGPRVCSGDASIARRAVSPPSHPSPRRLELGADLPAGHLAMCVHRGASVREIRGSKPTKRKQMLTAERGGDRGWPARVEERERVLTVI